MRYPAVLPLLFALAAPGVAQAGDVYVNPAQPGCSDAATIAVAASPSTPWCSPAPAVRLARPGDVVHLASATYGSQLRPATSGTPDQPIVYQAEPHSMAWCLECHRNPEGALRPLDQITNLNWQPTPKADQTIAEAQQEQGTVLRDKWHINPPVSNCAGCHR